MRSFEDWWEYNKDISTKDMTEQQIAQAGWGAASDEYEEKLFRLRKWAKAYSLEVFPEPDFEKVRKVLEDAGLSLDAVSASNMRHVIEQVKKIVDES